MAGSSDYCLSANYTLKEGHEYYAQVQLHMYTANCVYTDFLVWTPVDVICTRVRRNEQFISNMVVHTEAVWKSSVLPELLIRKLEESAQSQANLQSMSTDAGASKQYCICKTTTNLNNMVACDHYDDWFHPKCVDRKTLPKSKTWYCPACRKAKKSKN